MPHGILAMDPQLIPYEKEFDLREQHLLDMKQRLLDSAPGRLSDFANAHLHYGFHRLEGGWIYREWAPGADALHLFGDFNGWNRGSHPLRRCCSGDWEIFIPDRESADGCPAAGGLRHLSRVKVQVTRGGRALDRIPLYIRRAVQDPESYNFDGQIWAPEMPYVWQNPFAIPADRPPLIYECHIGMATERGAVGGYREFQDDVLPRVRDGGYNTLQIMAVMEHPYYASFGYQVTNFFAASSRFGTPDELKALIDAAHGMGIAVLLDVVHSHAAPNAAEGICQFDGTDCQFTHGGPRGSHPAWGTRLFNYGKPEVLHFLLSNLKFWLEEYHFDGFRFDGVTSMLYHDHGLGESFDHYRKYFGPNTHAEAVTYLQLANLLVHELRSDAQTVAEDMSGMPGMALPVGDGGLGFDYRLGMGVPDFWVRTLSKGRDEDWNLGKMWYELTTRRAGERNIGYCESHDQALVGDKTIMFWLADQEMYWHMRVTDESLAIGRAMALHKMIRLITFSLAGEGYLNFMGNEFGHPEWIDFPREGNNNSFHYARRQWSLADDESLRFRLLQAFDRAMLALVEEYRLLGDPVADLLLHDERRKLLAFEKQGLLMMFNFHPEKTYDAVLKIREPHCYRVVLDTQSERFGGWNRDDDVVLRPNTVAGEHTLHWRIASRTAMVFAQEPLSLPL